MNEPIEFRSVTDLEELDALPDDASILVVDNGTAKQISKANAKFGGGSVTKYLLADASTQSAQGDVAVQAVTNPTYTITHEDGSAVTAQEVYDAFMAGLVIAVDSEAGAAFVAVAINCRQNSSGVIAVRIAFGNRDIGVVVEIGSVVS